MDQIIQAKITRTERKSIALQISSSGELIVRAPKKATDASIQKFLDQHHEWITLHIKKVVRKPRLMPTTFVEGTSIFYLGKELKLYYHNSSQVIVTENELRFPKALTFRMDKELESWYIRQARSLITRRVDFYANEMKVAQTGLTFTDTKSQWGSCTHDNRLQFSWRLIMAPILTINYVVVHELTHITIKNHSRKFWDRVQYFNPSYKHQIIWLKENGNSLH